MPDKAVEPHDEWAAEAVGDKLTAYLDRVGLSGRDTAELSLGDLVAAHLRSIPFENLDPVVGTPVEDLSWQALDAKLIQNRRGGYCYEQNTLFSYVLRALGYRVDVLTGRVEWQSDGSVLPARTHEMLAVTPPGSSERYFVDVGFGGQTLSSPIRFEAGIEQQTRHEPYRIRRRDDLLVLESLIRERRRTGSGRG